MLSRILLLAKYAFLADCVPSCATSCGKSHVTGQICSRSCIFHSGQPNGASICAACSTKLAPPVQRLVQPVVHRNRCAIDCAASRTFSGFSDVSYVRAVEGVLRIQNLRSMENCFFGIRLAAEPTRFSSCAASCVSDCLA